MPSSKRIYMPLSSGHDLFLGGNEFEPLDNTTKHPNPHHREFPSPCSKLCGVQILKCVFAVFAALVVLAPHCIVYRLKISRLPPFFYPRNIHILFEYRNKALLSPVWSLRVFFRGCARVFDCVLKRKPCSNHPLVHPPRAAGLCIPPLHVTDVRSSANTDPRASPPRLVPCRPALPRRRREDFRPIRAVEQPDRLKMVQRPRCVKIERQRILDRFRIHRK